jgi:hypothetical protein
VAWGLSAPKSERTAPSLPLVSMPSKTIRSAPALGGEPCMSVADGIVQAAEFVGNILLIGEAFRVGGINQR